MNKLLKNTLLSISLLLATFYANANFVSSNYIQRDYNTDEVVTVDLYVNNPNPELVWLDMDYTFDDTRLTFLDFVFTDEVLNNTWYTDAFDFSGLSPITITLGFLDDWASNLPTSFKIGSVSFMATSNVNPDFSISYIDALNNQGDSIPTTAITAVPEPSSMFLFAIAFIGIYLQRVKNKVAQ